MYEQSRQEFTREVNAILEGAEQTTTGAAPDQQEFELDNICPACPEDTQRASRSESDVVAAQRHR